MTVDTAALIAISTIQDEDNFFNVMLDMKKEDGTPFFSSLRFFLACDDCRSKGVSSDCNHRKHDRPAWLSEEKFATLKSLYTRLGFKKLLEQEAMGSSSSTAERAFDLNLIKDLFNPSRTKPVRLRDIGNVDELFVSIDPNGGGRSHFALCSAFYGDANALTICGLESTQCKKIDDMCVLTINHIREVRRMLKSYDCRVTVFVESNLRFASQEICRTLVDSIPNVHVMHKDGYDVTGVHVGSTAGMQTTHKVKEKMYERLRDLLYKDQLAFTEKIMVTHDPDKKWKPVTDENEMIAAAITAKGMLRTQLTNYLIETKAPLDPAFQGTKVTFSGKRNGNDDLCIALQLIAWWSYISNRRRSNI
jgi:hypothetical protein